MYKTKYDLWASDREKAQRVLGGLLVLRTVSPIANQPVCRIWKPKAIKPFVNCRFKMAEDMEKYIAVQIANHQRHLQFMNERKNARKGTPEQIDAVKIGSIFHHSWGYEQTNCDYYEVIEKIGQFVKIREIATQTVEGSTYSHGMADMRKPVQGHFLKDEPVLTKKLQFSNGKAYLAFDYGWCDLWDGNANYCSWYG